MVKACCVKNCQSNGRNTNGKVSLHLFPTTNSELMTHWIEFLGYGNDWKPPKYAAICSHHFKQSDFSVNTNIRRLLSNAVPSIKTELIFNKIRRKSSLNKTRKKTERKKKTIDRTVDELPHENKVEDDAMCQDIRKTCRLCGFEYKTELKLIFEHDNSYADRINRYLYLSVSRDDTLPLSHCTTCQKKFEEIENFVIEVHKVQEILWKRFPCESKIHCENNIVDKPDINDTKMIISETSETKISNNPMIIYPTIINMNDNIILNQTDTENNNSKQIEYYHNDNIPSYSRSDYNSNSFIMIPDDKQFNRPIEMETITPMTNLCPTSHIIKPSCTNNNKKIEILQDIKLDPNQISFKSIYDESLLKINKNVQQKSCMETVQTPKKSVHMKKHKYDKVNTLLTSSNVECKQCGRKFISKYALTNHIKYICGIDEKSANKCKYCKKSITGKSEKSKFACRCSERATKSVQKRKAYQPRKLKQYIDCT